MTSTLFTVGCLTAIPIAGSVAEHLGSNSGPNIGLLKITVYWWMLFGMVLRPIDAVNAMQVNISIVQKKENSESVEIARLQHEHGKWTSASSLVLTVCLTVVLIVVIAFVFGVNEFARFAYMIVYMAIIIVLAIGFAFGVLRNFAKKISVVNDAFMELKESDQSA